MTPTEVLLIICATLLAVIAAEGFMVVAFCAWFTEVLQAAEKIKESKDVDDADWWKGEN